MLIEFTAELSGLTANPTHGLSAQTGVVLTASATGYSGSAPRSVRYQWGTVESGDIQGATSATYMPDAAILDGETLFCRIMPSDGYPATDTLGFVIRHVPPVAAGGLWDVVLDLGSAAELFDVAGDFTGESLAYSVTGPGTSIDAGTGLLTIQVDSPVSGVRVVVTVLNSGGSASSSFALTVEDDDLGPGPYLAPPAMNAAANTIDLTVDTDCTIYWRRDATGTNLDAVQIIAGDGYDSGAFAVSAGVNSIDITFATGNDGLQEISFVAAVTPSEPSIVQTVAIDIDTSDPVLVSSLPPVGARAVSTAVVPALTFDKALNTTLGAVTLAMIFFRTVRISVTVDGGVLADTISVYADAIIFGFDTDYAVGTYWNGDPWVERPSGGNVTITAITPAGQGRGAIAASTGADRVQNGAMLNWNTGVEADDNFANIYWGAEGQAFDSHQPTSASFLEYDNTRQVDPTLTGASLVISAEGAVLKAKSNADGDLGTGSAARGTVLTDVGLLTVVDASPPANAFRPGAHTLTKAHRWTTADVDYSLVPLGLTAPASTPSYADALNKVGRHHLMGSLHYDKMRVIMPQNHMRNYGQNNAAEIIDAVLTSMTDSVTTEQRENLLNCVVQIGVDVYDRYNEGGRWHVNGGLYRGYKLPLVVAATLLDDTGMKAVADINPSTGANVWDAFGDDRAIWYLTSADTGRTLDGGHEQYIASDEGDPEWGEQHTYNASRDDRREDATYRDINTRGIVGAALACQMITGARANWNWQAHFDYADRIMERDFYASGETLTWGGTNFIANYSGSNPVPQFQKDMWSSFRANYGAAIWDR